MSKLISTWTEFAKNRKKLIAIVVSVIIIIPTISLVIFYQYRKSQVADEINQIRLNVTQFNIVSSGENYVITKGNAEIDNLSGTFDLSTVSFSRLEFEVFYLEETIASSSIPISNSAFSEGLEFEIKIPVSPGNSSHETTEVLVNILLAKNFEMEFKGKLYYSYYGINDYIEIENKLHFALNQKGMMLHLDYFDLQNTSEDSDILFSVYNPLKIPLQIGGDVDVVLDNDVMGKINVTKRTLPSGWSKVEEIFSPSIAKEEIMKRYIQNLDNTVDLETSLTFGFGDLIFNANAVLNLSPTSLNLDYNLIDIQSTNFDTEENMVNFRGDINFTSTLPIDLNISNFQSLIYVNNQKLGNIYWDGPFTMLSSNKPVVLSDIRANFTVNTQILAIFNSNTTYSLRETRMNLSVNNQVIDVFIPQIVL